MHRSWLVPLLSGLLAVVIVTGVVAVATHDSRPSAAPTRPTTTTGPAPSTTSTTAAPATTSTTVAAAPAPGSVEAFVPVAEKFVEQHRGLTFKQPVPVTVLDDAAFRKKLAADDTPDDPAEIQKSQKDLRALGLIPPGLDLAKTENELLGGDVSGFYDSKAKALFVRGVAATPYVREVIVHELTHAVQDQYFGLDRPGLTNRDDEAFDGFQALYEGDAERVRGE